MNEFRCNAHERISNPRHAECVRRNLIAMTKSFQNVSHFEVTAFILTDTSALLVRNLAKLIIYKRKFYASHHQLKIFLLSREHEQEKCRLAVMFSPCFVKML